MELIVTSKELDKKEIYFLTKAQDAQKMRDAKDQTLDLAYWCIYEDVNSDGELQTIFSCRTDDGDIYATNSDTFIRAFKDILDVFDPSEIKRIKVASGTSKNNREFITCIYAE